MISTAIGALRAYDAEQREARRAQLLAPPARLPRIYRPAPPKPTMTWVCKGDAVEIHWPDGRIERGVAVVGSRNPEAIVRVRWHSDKNTTRHVVAHLECWSETDRHATWRLHLPTDEFTKPPVASLDLTRPKVRRRYAREVDRFLIAHGLRLDRMRYAEGSLLCEMRAEDVPPGLSGWTVAAPYATLRDAGVPLPSDMADMLAQMRRRNARGEPARDACADAPHEDAWWPGHIGPRCAPGLRRGRQVRFGIARRPRLALPCRSDRTRTTCAATHWGTRCITLDPPLSLAASAIVLGAAALFAGGLARG